MKNTSLKIVLLHMLLLICFAQTSAQITAKAQLEKNTIKIGEAINLKLTVTQPAATVTIWPEIPNEITEKVEVTERFPLDTTFTPNKDQITFTQNYTITSFDSGIYKIPALPFRYIQGAETLQTTADSLFLYVNTIPVDTTQAIKDVKSVLEIPFDWREMLPYVLAALLGIALIVLFIYWLRRYLKNRKQNAPIEPEAPKIPAHVIAFEKFEILKAKKLWQENRVKTYYTELVDIIREYIGNRYGVDATEMTTAEIMQALQLRCPEKEALQKLKSALELSDMVKFAKANPIAIEHEQAFDVCVDFVKATMQNITLNQNPQNNDRTVE